MARKLDYIIIDLLESSARNLKAHPLNLGGIAGVGGGVGGPPGGFIGWLPQTRVAYDEDELATLATSVSGSLLDNLNHIRYRLELIEAGSGVLVVDEYDGSPSVSPTDRISFSGATVTDLGGGRALITINASGGSGTPLTVEELDGSPSVTNVDKIIFSGATVIDQGSGDVLVSISGHSLTIENVSKTVSKLNPHYLEFSDNDFVLTDLGDGVLVNTGLIVMESDGSPSVNYVHKIIFSGATVSNPSSGEALVTFSGGFPVPFALPNDITPPPLTTGQDNYNPAGLSTADVLRISPQDTADFIYGIAGGTDGRILYIHNIGPGALELANEAPSSNPQNRLSFGNGTMGTDVHIPSGAATIVQYDSTSQRWRGLANVANSLQGASVGLGITEVLQDGDVLFWDAGIPAFVPTTLSGAYLKLDTSNDPLTGQLRIVSTTPGAGGIYTEAYGDSYAADFEGFTTNDNVPSNTVFLYRETNGTGNITGAMIEGWQYDTGAGVISGPWIMFKHEGTETFQVTRSGSVNIPTGQTYNINNSPHTHDSSTIVNRTRYIPVPSVWDASAGSTVPVTDAHGSLNQEPHFHLPNAVTTIIKSSFSLPLPSDYVSGTTNIVYFWSSSVGDGGAVRWQTIIREIGSTSGGETTHTQLLVDTSSSVCNTANEVRSRTIALTTNPTAGKMLSFNIIRLGGDANDTNTGDVSLWGVRLEYPSDM